MLSVPFQSALGTVHSCGVHFDAMCCFVQLNNDKTTIFAVPIIMLNKNTLGVKSARPKRSSPTYVCATKSFTSAEANSRSEMS